MNNPIKISSNRKAEIYTELLECFSFEKINSTKPENDVDAILTGNEEIVLFGGGGFGIDFMLRVASRHNLKIKCIIDNKFNNPEKFFGYDAMNFNQFLESKYNSESCTVLVCVYRDHVLKQILKTLHDHNFKKIKLATDFYDIQLIYPPKILLDNYRHYYEKSKNDILSAYHLFDDEVSCESYLRCIKTHLNRELIQMIEFPEEDQYLPKDIKLKHGLSRIIDCGAYDGDTVKKIIAENGKIEALACFEPNINTFDKLSSYVEMHSANIATDVILFPCGVANSNNLEKFSQNGASSSMHSPNVKDIDNQTFIPVMKIDSALPNFRPTYIIMDIEGSELNALMGAEKTLKKYLPDLAICVYHTPNHYWEIPLFLSRLNIGYKFYLRNYTHFTNESVMYATT